MKEFIAQTGGRYTYADDLENLQDLALAFSQLFDDCDNFILSGCEVSGNSISAGYVYLNGKLRYFSGATGLSGWPQYIYELNSSENMPYESGGTKNGRNIFGCTIGKTIPSEKDALTNKIPSAIIISSAGGLRMKDAFLGKYVLLLNPAVNLQAVNSVVRFNKPVQAYDDLTACKNVVIKSGVLQTVLGYTGTTFFIKSIGGLKNYQFKMTEESGMRFYVDDELIATIGATEVNFAKPVVAPQGTFNGLVINRDSIYQGLTEATTTLKINVEGFEGEGTYYRNTAIGNGKGKVLFSVLGTIDQIHIFGPTVINAGTMDGLILRAASDSLENAIAWSDFSGKVLARAGFIHSTSSLFSIKAPNNGIEIIGGSSVNIGPKIMENGVLLSTKYVLLTTLETELEKKANVSEVYSALQADDKFAIKSGGLSQFVTSTVSQEACRSHIEAIGFSDLNGYAKKDRLLSDMAITESDKKQIRDNIGAASAGDYEPKLSDTGWKQLRNFLYIRQIGNIVCIQGSLNTIHSGTVFTIPNIIDPPAYTVQQTIAIDNNHSWVCKIEGGQRACTVAYCDNSCNKPIDFSLTYMV